MRPRRDAAADDEPAPRWLVWPAAGAVVLSLVAFLLWGLGGAGAVLDMVVAWCT